MAGVRKKTALVTAESVGLVNNPDQHIPVVHKDELEYAGLAKLKFDVLSDGIVTLDTKRAAEYIDLPIFPGEREVVDSHVQFLYDEMLKGTFNHLLVVLSTAVLNGVTYKINGQHTCWAVVYMAGKKKDYSLQVREIRYRVANEEQLKLLYATYDRLKARSDTHVSKVFLIGTKAAEGVANKLLSKLTGGFKFWFIDSDEARRRISPEQMAALIQREHTQLFNTVGQFTSKYLSNVIATRQPVLAAMLATFDKVPTKAPEFWTAVIEGLGLTTKTDPRYVLRESLMKVSTKVSKYTASNSKREKRYMTNEEMYRICISAFNKWRKGETSQAALRATKDRIKPV